VRAPKPGLAAPVAFAAVLGLALGCPQRHAWQQDESRRIDEVLRSEKFSEDLPEAKGTPFSAPASTALPLPTSNYSIQNAPPKNRATPHRGGARGVDTGSSTSGLQHSTHSRVRHKRDELTSAPSEEGSSSHQP
jgi:hypothetical protein